MRIAGLGLHPATAVREMRAERWRLLESRSLPSDLSPGDDPRALVPARYFRSETWSQQSGARPRIGGRAISELPRERLTYADSYRCGGRDEGILSLVGPGNGRVVSRYQSRLTWPRRTGLTPPGERGRPIPLQRHSSETVA